MHPHPSDPYGWQYRHALAAQYGRKLPDKGYDQYMKDGHGKYYAPGYGYYGGAGDRTQQGLFARNPAAVNAALDKSGMTMNESKSLSPKRFRHMPFAVPPPVPLIKNGANVTVSAPVEMVDPIHSYLDPISVSL